MAPAEPAITIDDPRYVKALAHPLRIRILAALEERPSSPVQLARALDSTLGRVSHHVTVLRRLGLLELVETHRRRGAIEHVYRAPRLPNFSDGAWERLGVSARRRVVAAMLEQIGDYVAGSAAAGGFDRADANLSRVPMRLDDAGWAELAAAGRRWLAEADAIRTRSLDRVGADQQADLRDAGLVLLMFDALAFSDRTSD